MLGNKRWLLAAIVILAVLVACVSWLVNDKWAMRTSTLDLEPGKLAPAFTLKDATGKQVTLQNYRGKIVFLTFWASWCELCLPELMALQSIFDENKDNIMVLAVNIDAEPRKLFDLSQAKHIAFPLLIDKQGKVAQRYHLRAVPELWVIDQAGYIWGHFPGFVQTAFLKNIYTVMRAEGHM